MTKRIDWPDNFGLMCDAAAFCLWKHLLGGTLLSSFQSLFKLIWTPVPILDLKRDSAANILSLQSKMANRHSMVQKFYQVGQKRLPKAASHWV